LASDPRTHTHALDAAIIPLWKESKFIFGSAPEIFGRGLKKSGGGRHMVCLCVRSLGAKVLWRFNCINLRESTRVKKINESRARGRQMLRSEANLANGIARCQHRVTNSAFKAIITPFC